MAKPRKSPNKNPRKQVQTRVQRKSSPIHRFLLFIPPLVLLVHALHYNFIADDTFITLRYAHNIASGLGPVYNFGEWVEGFSSPLWAVLLSVFSVFGGDLLQVARATGLLAGVVSLVLLYRFALRYLGPESTPFAAAFAALIPASNASFACWAASGMETMLFSCLILASYFAVFYDRHRLAAVLCSLLILTRPEGLIIAVVLAAYLLSQRGRKDRSTRLFLASTSATLFILFIVRRLLYGYWLPNTYYAKVGGGSEAFVRGLRYFIHSSADNAGLVLILATLGWALLSANSQRKALAFGAAGLWAAAIAVGGDGLPMYRFLVAPLALLAILYTEMGLLLFRGLRAIHLRPALIRATLGIAGFSLILVQAIPPQIGPYYELYSFQKEVEVPRWTLVGRWLAQNAEDGDSVAAVPIGAIGYYSGLETYDMLGLTDRHIAHLEMAEMGQGWAGHEKHDGQYILSHRPTYILAGNIDITSKPRDPSRYPFIPYGNRSIWEREKDLYTTDFLRKNYEGHSEEISSGQFLNFYKLKNGHGDAGS